MTAPRYTFPRTRRIIRHGEFQRVMRDGVRLSDSRLSVWALGNGGRPTRLGLVVGRRHGNAVQRNRIKRLLREAFRLVQHELPDGIDLACAPQPDADLTLDPCRQSLQTLAARLARRLAKRDDPKTGETDGPA